MVERAIDGEVYLYVVFRPSHSSLNNYVSINGCTTWELLSFFPWTEGFSFFGSSVRHSRATDDSMLWIFLMQHAGTDDGYYKEAR